jgi:5-(carboxyamino)imidazole ribonucleotide synthase
MVNLLGNLPPLDDILAIPGAHLHLYGKDPRPRRKLAHCNVVATSSDDRDAGLERLLHLAGRQVEETK